MSRIGAYTLQDLVSYTDVPARRIRHWISLGVVPPAYGGRGPEKYRYGPEHLHAIRETLEFQDNQMTLAELAERKRYLAGEFDDDDDPADKIDAEQVIRELNRSDFGGW